MKKNVATIFVFAVVCLLAGCVGSKLQTSNQPMSDNSRLLTLGPVWGTLYQQKAAEYKALTFQAYNIARERLDTYLQQPGNLPFAVITDIDETVLDNSPNTVHNALQGKTYSDESWMKWSEQAAADTVPGAPAFFKYAASRNVTVFYISNRSIDELNATIANLKKYNLPFADTAHVLLRTTTSSKDARRARVTAQHQVLLYFGDNLGDFSGEFDKQPVAERAALAQQNAARFGSRFIVLPNPVYGDWANALFNYKYGDSMRVKADAMIKSLTTY